MVPYKTSPYMGCPYMPKIHTWLAYMHVMYGPIYDFFLQGICHACMLAYMRDIYDIYVRIFHGMGQCVYLLFSASTVLPKPLKLWQNVWESKLLKWFGAPKTLGVIIGWVVSLLNDEYQNKPNVRRRLDAKRCVLDPISIHIFVLESLCLSVVSFFLNIRFESPCINPIIIVLMTSFGDGRH